MVGCMESAMSESWSEDGGKFGTVIAKLTKLWSEQDIEVNEGPIDKIRSREALRTSCRVPVRWR